MVDEPIANLISHPEPSNKGRPYIWVAILLVLVLMVVAVAFLGPRAEEVNPSPTVTVTSTPEREARIYVVSYRFGVFSPTNLRIHAGDTVRFRNDSPLPIRVTAQLQPGQRVPEFDSVGPIQADSYFSYTFPTVGIYGYINASDKTEAGVIIVR